MRLVQEGIAMTALRWLGLVVVLGCQATPVVTPDTFTKNDFYHDVAGGVVLHGTSGQCYDLVIGKFFADTDTDNGNIRMVGVKERSCE